jgi:hypothetical protein
MQKNLHQEELGATSFDRQKWRCTCSQVPQLCVNQKSIEQKRDGFTPVIIRGTIEITFNRKVAQSVSLPSRKGSTWTGRNSDDHSSRAESKMTHYLKRHQNRSWHRERETCATSEKGRCRKSRTPPVRLLVPLEP